MRRSLFGLLLLFSISTACRDDSAGTPSSAEVRWTDAGAELHLDAHALPVPAGDLADGAKPSVVQDKEGKRLAYPTKSGEVRYLYRIGDEIYAGPHAKAPVDFKVAPDLDHALGAIFENAPKKSALLENVGRTLGDGGIVHLLVDGAEVQAPEWEAAYDKLAEPKRAEVRAGLATFLLKGKPTGGLRRAVRYIPLREPARAPGMNDRLHELVDGGREPRAAAVMLRALAPLARDKASAIGCAALQKLLLDAAPPTGTPEEIDLPGRDELVEASLLAIAHASITGDALACPKPVEAALTDMCIPQMRCASGVPMTGRELESHWDEPTCTKPELVATVAKELERPAKEILDLSAGTRRELFAVAALTVADKIPPAFVAAQERRRYAVVQPKDPPCEGAAPGTPCRCDENTIRSYGCRANSPHKTAGEGTSVQVGVCKFDIDDKTKKLTNVVATPPP